MTVDQNQQVPAGENPNQAVIVPAEALPSAEQKSPGEGQGTANVPEFPVVAPPAETESAISSRTAESASTGTEVGTAQTPSPTVQDTIVSQSQVTPLVQDDQASPMASTQPAQAPLVDDTAAFAGDDVYLKEADRVMREDAEKPYEEEEDLEMIQKDYLEKRFDFKVGKDQE